MATGCTAGTGRAAGTRNRDWVCENGLKFALAGENGGAFSNHRTSRYIESHMSDKHRLGFLVIEAEPAQGLSTRKLLLESAKHNVLTAYTPEEGIAMFRRFSNVDVVAVDGGFGEAACVKLVDDIKKVHPKIRIVAFMPNVGGYRDWADETISSHDPAGLLKLLQEMGGRTDIA